MLVPRIKRRADRGTRALKRLVTIEADITGLADEDLLDLVDIFQGRAGSIIAEVSTAEMNKRGLSL